MCPFPVHFRVTLYYVPKEVLVSPWKENGAGRISPAGYRNSGQSRFATAMAIACKGSIIKICGTNGKTKRYLQSDQAHVRGKPAVFLLSIIIMVNALPPRFLSSAFWRCSTAARRVLGWLMLLQMVCSATGARVWSPGFFLGKFWPKLRRLPF